MAASHWGSWLRRAAAAALVLLITEAAAIEGSYSGQFNGQPAQAQLKREGGAMHGTLDIGGYVYRLQVRAEGGGFAGQMHDQEGGVVPVTVQADAGRLLVRAYTQGPVAPPVELILSPDTAAAAPSIGEQTVERDGALVGRWVRSESYTSGDFSVVNETSVTLYPDGTYQHGPGRVVGGGSAGSFDSGSSGSGASGHWRTANRILYTMEPGSGWVPYARYYVEGAQLMLTFGDGSRELWSRR